MSKLTNYGEWDNIELSDDENDTHPNIDTDSLNRWRHTARLQRREQRLEERNEHENKRKELDERRKKLKELEQTNDNISFINFEKEILEKDEYQWKENDDKIKKHERLRPKDVDDLSHDGKISKTSINTTKSIDQFKTLTQEEQTIFYKKHKENIKTFGMLQRYDDTQIFLEEHSEIICEETANYLIVWCIDLEIEEKHNLMEHVSHQAMIMQFILELSKIYKVNPRTHVRPFFIQGIKN